MTRNADPGPWKRSIVCGIAGALSAHPLSPDSERMVMEMASTLHHRGPDAEGVWSDRDAGIAFGHRRLKVIDISEAGHQPMVSADGRYVLCYNGEVYTAPELRADLPKVNFRGHSDTEVIVEACAAWGVERTLERLVGMFAFALWDRHRRALVLARDHLGIKPLYWAQVSGALLFSSEIRAFHAWPGFCPEIDRNALASYFRHTYVPAPNSVYTGVSKLPPGHMLVVSEQATPKLLQYWNFGNIVGSAASNRFSGPETAMVHALNDLAGDSVERQLIADVPVGAFLSGGIDSSLVAALMQSRSSSPIRTFTMAFEDSRYDESDHARAIAKHLGTDHTELHVTARNALDLTPRLADIYDEPFADSSQIPTHLVSLLAQKNVTVALSGDGGDELFDGYDRYPHAQRQWSRIGWLPAPARHLIAGFGEMLPLSGRIRHWRDAATELLNCADADAVLHRTASSWQRPEELLTGAEEARTVYDDTALRGGVDDQQDRFQMLDGLTHLPDDVLTKVDRASMAVSLEVRVPLLDHRIAEFAFRIPPALRRKDGKGKWPLRQVLKNYVPEKLFDRPKKGFMVPIGQWLRTELRDWSEELLDRRKLIEGGLINAATVHKKWAEHKAGQRDWSSQLWTVLMFQSWHARWVK